MDDRGIKHIDKFNLIGITILGSRNGQPVKEGINDAHLSVLAQIKDDDPIYNKQREALCFAYQKLDEQTADRVNINRKESADLDNQETFDFKILVDKSKDALSDTPWGDVDKTELRRKVVEASNYEEVAGDIFLDLRDGWKDKEVTALKYPVMQLKENTAVYNREALSTALGYARKNEESEIIGKIMKIYEALDIDVEQECKFVECEDCTDMYGCPCEELGKECEAKCEEEKPEEAYEAEHQADTVLNECPEEGKDAPEPAYEHGEDCTCEECMSKKQMSSDDDDEHGDGCECPECAEKCEEKPEEAYEDDKKDSDDDKADEDDKDEDDDESKPEDAYAELLSAHNALMEENSKLKDELAKMAKENEELAAKCADYDALAAQCDELKMAMFKVECEKRLQEAKRLLNGENFSTEGREKIFEECKEGKYASYEDLRKEIALQLFNYNHKDESSKEVFSALPQFESINTEKKTNKKKSSQESLRDYLGKNK